MGVLVHRHRCEIKLDIWGGLAVNSIMAELCVMANKKGENMLVKQLIEDLKKHNMEAEVLIVLTPELPFDIDDVSWHAVSSVIDGGWENKGGTSPIIGLNCGELIIG